MATAEPEMSEEILLSVVIPVYNEIKTLQIVLDRVRAVDVDKEIILVDDFSDRGSLRLHSVDSASSIFSKVIEYTAELYLPCRTRKGAA